MADTAIIFGAFKALEARERTELEVRLLTFSIPADRFFSPAVPALPNTRCGSSVSHQYFYRQAVSISSKEFQRESVDETVTLHDKFVGVLLRCWSHFVAILSCLGYDSENGLGL